MATSGRAVVVGGSLGGLLATRVLADHFAEVVLVERDRFPAGPEARKGVPQARHLHVLLQGGERILAQHHHLALRVVFGQKPPGEALARRLALGGALFLCSDALLAINKFAAPLPAANLWILATYWAAQWLIASWLAPPPLRSAATS